jgi:hypothetical protein
MRCSSVQRERKASATAGSLQVVHCSTDDLTQRYQGMVNIRHCG